MKKGLRSLASITSERSSYHRWWSAAMDAMILLLLIAATPEFLDTNMMANL